MAKNWAYKTPGIPDELFIQNDECLDQQKRKSSNYNFKSPLKRRSVVIDVGCGTGGLTVEAALQVAPKGKVTP